MDVQDGGIEEIARRSRGTPRVANRLLKRVRDYAQVLAGGVVTREVAIAALTQLEVDYIGLDEVDHKILRTIIEKFDGGPVGLDTIAASISEEADTIMDVYEPFLLQLGFLERTPRGRVATPLAYEHLGLPYPKGQPPQAGLRRRTRFMVSILMHTCCAPCAIYCVKHLRERWSGVTAFWYNPNIHPYMEHQHRLESMQEFAHLVDLPLVVSEGYEMINYFRAVVGHEGNRCKDCFHLRLSKTASIALERGFDGFTTTLLISPYQEHELLKKVGEEVAEEISVEFHYEDFRAGFRESQNMARELGLYRQRYCGCVYSEWERYGKIKIKDLG